MPDHDPRTVYLLSAHAGCVPKTARAWLTGRDVRGDILRARLTEAARSLGVERSAAPPAPSSPPPKAA